MSEIQERKFDIGDRVVHPQHGVGYVADQEERQFEPNASRMYYVISIPDITIWVPIGLTNSGLRKLSDKSEIDQCRRVLQSAPLPLIPDRGMLASLSGRINQGSVIAHCEVLRDLTALGWRKPLYGPTSDYRRAIMHVLCQEWAIVEEISLAEASSEIDDLLIKGKAAHEH